MLPPKWGAGAPPRLTPTAFFPEKSLAGDSDTHTGRQWNSSKAKARQTNPKVKDSTAISPVKRRKCWRGSDIAILLAASSLLRHRCLRSSPLRGILSPRLNNPAAQGDVAPLGPRGLPPRFTGPGAQNQPCSPKKREPPSPLSSHIPKHHPKDHSREAGGLAVPGGLHGPPPSVDSVVHRKTKAPNPPAKLPTHPRSNRK